MKLQVIVTLKPDVLDPQGSAIKSSLSNMGFKNIESLRQGKTFEIIVKEKDEKVALSKAKDIFFPHHFPHNHQVQGGVPPRQLRSALPPRGPRRPDVHRREGRLPRHRGLARGDESQHRTSTFEVPTEALPVSQEVDDRRPQPHHRGCDEREETKARGARRR